MPWEWILLPGSGIWPESPSSTRWLLASLGGAVEGEGASVVRASLTLLKLRNFCASRITMRYTLMINFTSNRVVYYIDKSQTMRHGNQDTRLSRGSYIDQL